MLKNGVKCKLTVIKMKGWKRKMDYVKTGLQWIPSSPHVPHTHSPFFYPISGIVGEFGYYSIGVGYTIPFEMFGAPWIKADELANAMNALNLPGVIFRPIYAKPFYSVFSGKQIEGVQIHITDVQKAPLSPINFLFLQEAARLYPEHKLFEKADKGRYNMFDIVCGSKHIREAFSKRHRWADIEAYWNKDVKEFKNKSKKCHLY